MKRGFISILSMCLAVAMTAGCSGNVARVGEVLPAWSEGEIDIHTISTGRGECLYIILPDGTDIIVDAGEFSRETKRHANVSQRPSADVRPTKVFGDYIRHFMPEGKSAVDYFNLSHFHMDHMGNIEPEYTKAAEGDYTLTGVMALYHHVPFREVIDRAYPDYDSLAVKAMSVGVLEEYKRFLAHHTAAGTLKATRFELGAVNQFALQHNAAAYPNLTIENVCSNGYVWESGAAADVYEGIRDQLRENAASCGFVIRYGAFDFLTAGDIGDYHDLEQRVAAVVGDIDAVKAHHHLSPHSMLENTMDILRPEVLVATSFYERDIQPDKSKFDYIREDGCDIFCTSVDLDYAEQDKEAYAKCAALNGHIVIRVAAGGDSYTVYTLDDSNTEYRITQIDGPYYSK